MSCLVLAMTGTSAMLGWMAPTPTRGQTAPDRQYVDQLIRLARSAVTDDVVVLPGRWHKIDVMADPQADPDGRLLAAKAGSAPWHFYVDRDGRAARASSWREQRAPSGFPHTVRIQVATAREGSAATLVQWLGVRALIATLNETVSVDRTALPVTFPHTWDRIHDTGLGRLSG